MEANNNANGRPRSYLSPPPSSSNGSQQQQDGQEHSFLMDRADVEQMEKSLLDLLDDFKKGKLHAFGGDSNLEKMNRVRDLQEKSAQLHFELEEEETGKGMTLSEQEQEKLSQDKLEKLMKTLENLCSSVQSLHQLDNE